MGVTLEPITDPIRAEQAASLLDGIAERPEDLRLDWIARHGWTAVPVEGSMHFDERGSELLSGAMNEAGHVTCLGVITDLLPEGETRCYRVSTSTEGLLAFSRECSHFNCALIPISRQFVVLCTVDDYYLVAGPRAFVTRAIGSTIETARKTFLEFATLINWPEPVKTRFVSVAERYQHRDGL